MGSYCNINANARHLREMTVEVIEEFLLRVKEVEHNAMFMMLSFVILFEDKTSWQFILILHI